MTFHELLKQGKLLTLPEANLVAWGAMLDLLKMFFLKGRPSLKLLSGRILLVHFHDISFRMLIEFLLVDNRVLHMFNNFIWSY